MQFKKLYVLLTFIYKKSCSKDNKRGKMSFNNSMKRVRTVVQVFFKYGLGAIIREAGLHWHLPFIQKLMPARGVPSDMPVRVRKAFEELGGAYIKLGQLLALRPDLVPKEYCEEFRKLLDEAKPIPFSTVKRIIETELKAPISHYFKRIDEKPIGSASIAQVHRAKLNNGKDAVIKIQRPEARQQFESDVDIMHFIAGKLEKRFSKKTFSPTIIVQEFERYTKNELNFVIEARNLDRFYEHFKKFKTMRTPRVFWDLTTGTVLTMEFLPGKKLSDLDALHGYNKTLIARRIADAMFEQVMEIGIFHADLHPGNILIEKDNSIALLDFGIIGNLDDDLKRRELEIYMALINKDTEGVMKTLLRVGTPTSETNLESFRTDVENIVNEWYGKQLGKTRVTQMMHLLFDTCIQHKIRMPVNLILLGKALVTVEGTCLTLDPNFNFVIYSEPKLRQILRKQKHPKALLERFTKQSRKIGEMLEQLPNEAIAIASRLKEGRFTLDMNDTDVRHLGMDINTSSNRVSYAMLIASLIIAGALLIDVKPLFQGYSVLTIAIFLAAGIILFSLLISVWKEGRIRYDPHRKL